MILLSSPLSLTLKRQTCSTSHAASSIHQLVGAELRENNMEIVEVSKEEVRGERGLIGEGNTF